jgi:hypothetical protein
VQWPTALLILTLPLQASVSLSFRLELDEDNGSLYRVEFDRQGSKGSLFAACVQRELYSRFLEGVSQDLRRFFAVDETVECQSLRVIGVCPVGRAICN